MFWPSVQTIYSFGDSYSTIGWDVGRSPSITNPFGVAPDSPNLWGKTSANAENWLWDLATQQNKSVILVSDFAVGGATVDSNLVKPYLDTVKSFVEQVGEWEQIKGRDTSALHTVWFGINDVTSSSYNVKDYGFYKNVLVRYSEQVRRLVAGGARNFLFINVPPLERSPHVRSLGSLAISQETFAINFYNDRLREMVDEISSHTGGKVMLYDIHSNFGYSGIQDFCPAYRDNPSLSTDRSCQAGIDGYFWLNDLHVTSAIHRQIAADVAKFLNSN